MTTIVKTAGSLDKVLESCNKIGARYQPKSTGLTPTALSLLLERAQQLNVAVTATRAAYKLAVINRRESFAGIPKLAVRIVRMIASAKGSPEQVTAAEVIKNKFYHPKKSRKALSAATPEDGSSLARRSSGRMSFEAQMQTFADLIQIVEEIGSYNPNEADLKLDGLKAKYADLQNKSHAVNKARIAYDHARNERNLVFFGSQGVIETIRAVKDYVRAAFGTRSPELSMMTKRS